MNSLNLRFDWPIMGMKWRSELKGQSRGGCDMETFVPILGMSMIVIGLVLLLIGFGFLMYAIWLRYRVEPLQRKTESAAGVESFTTTGQL